MAIGKEIEKISRYLKSDKSWPIVADFQTRESLNEVKEYFHVGNTRFLTADHFCGKDGTFKLEELYNAVQNNSGDTFIIGLTAFLKLGGKDYTKKVITSLLSSIARGHIVVLTYQCSACFSFSNPTFSERGQIVQSREEPDTLPAVFLVSPKLSFAFPQGTSGFESISCAIENPGSETAYIFTEVGGISFNQSLISVSVLDDYYEMLCRNDERTRSLSQTLGTPEQWCYALQSMGANGDWTSAVSSQFGSLNNISELLSSYQNYPDERRWLLYISLSLFCPNSCTYLRFAVDNAANYTELVQSLFRSILRIDHNSSDFSVQYEQRKDILRHCSGYTAEIKDFCKVVSTQGVNSIYYLTDLSRPEKEYVIKWLDKHGENYSLSQIKTILGTVYPDLADYLSDYSYPKDFLSNYFKQYKYQKVINKLLPSFETIVDEQATEQDFYTLLDTRSSLMEKVDFSGTQVYFFDAFGVEYLGFIREKCKQYNLSTQITCARCNIPSLTSTNSEFVQSLAQNGHSVINNKKLDEIKHQGEVDYDYEKDTAPIYLIDELRVIDELLQKIRDNLSNGYFSKAVILSDHGASRLAVLHNTENTLKMSSTGIHSGRCCMKTEMDVRPEKAADGDMYWALANYDRFQGGRKASYEVHGGATIEELAVPIIEISQATEHIEAYVLDPSKVFSLGAKEFPTLRIYVGLNHSDSISILLDDNKIPAKPTEDDCVYSVELPDYTKKGIYKFSIAVDSNIVSDGQTFEIKKKGMSVNNLFD